MESTRRFVAALAGAAEFGIGARWKLVASSAPKVVETAKRRKVFMPDAGGWVLVVWDGLKGGRNKEYSSLGTSRSPAKRHGT